jgi:hypothetical protein
MTQPPSFDNLINKFKSSTKQYADSVSKAARKTKLKMDIMSQNAEKSRLLQNVGEKTYQLYVESKGLDGLMDRVKNEFSMIQRIEARIKEIEDEVAELSVPTQDDITDATEVKDVTKPEQTSSAEEPKHE